MLQHMRPPGKKGPVLLTPSNRPYQESHHKNAMCCLGILMHGLGPEGVKMMRGALMVMEYSMRQEESPFSEVPLYSRSVLAQQLHLLVFQQ